MGRIVETVGVEGIDRVEPLWRAMVDHHREVVGREIPVRPTDATWPLRRAQYDEWLSSGDARGAGLGSLLIGAAREWLRERDVTYWSVGVVEANAGAVRLYEREGFGPFWRALIATV
jgi:GNAT superfamily N-acetyltransferase